MIAVVTAVAGRHEHLRLQLRGLRAGTMHPDLHVVVSMQDPAVAEICAGSATVLDIPVPDGRMPLAAARNAGAHYALAAGADALVFLDVDCVPSPGLVERYDAVANDAPGALISGTVCYLPAPPPTGYVLETLAQLADAHPARPNPPGDAVLPLDHALFWSLSFATHRQAWLRIGGFHTGYTGYGAEDTDFAQLARARGVAHLAIGGATAYHQWHPTADPPVQHLEAILRNGRIFRDRWGWWPMQGWLDAFRESGRAAYDRVLDDWTSIEQSVDVSG